MEQLPLIFDVLNLVQKHEQMKLRKKVLDMLDTNKGLALIMATLDVSPTTARTYVANNDDSLTKAAMMKAIRETYGLTDEQILDKQIA